MLKNLFYVFMLCIGMLQLSHAHPETEMYSKNVYLQKEKIINLINGFFLISPEEINAAPQLSDEFKHLLIEDNEEKLKQYVAQQKQQYIAQLRVLLQQGDQTAVLLLAEWAVVLFKDEVILQDGDIERLQNLSQHNNAQATYLLALLSESSDEYLDYLERAGQQGSLAAQMRLTDEYSFRLPTEQQDQQKAEYWAEKAQETAGPEKYKEMICQMANCDLPSFELYDFGPETGVPMPE